MNKKFLGALMVSMVATAVYAADAPAVKAAPEVKAAAKVEHLCQNNDCKGKADCMAFGNDSCKGQNKSKTTGYKDANNKADCMKMHGTWTAKK